MNEIPQLPISKSLLVKWVEKLKSPDAPPQTVQGLVHFLNGEYCYCALGVLGLVSGWRENNNWSLSYPELHFLAEYDYSIPCNPFDEMVEKWNDEEKCSFTEIASRLEKMYLTPENGD